LGVLVSASCVARADDGETQGLRWNPRFTRFTTAQYMLTLATAGGVIATGTMLKSADEARWHSQIMLDGPARNALAASTVSGRKNAGHVSDFLGLGLVLYPFVVDALLVAGAGHGNYDLTLQLTMIGLQSALIANLVTNITKHFAARARPDVSGCRNGTEISCGSKAESFLSGHTSAAFASAGLICATHQNFALYGAGAAGAIACGASLVAAGTVGTLRIVADRHYMSDVLAGAAVGLAAGYLLPNLTNYHFGGGQHSDRRPTTTLVPMASSTQLGLAYVGLF